MLKFESAEFIAAFDAVVASGSVTNWSYSGRLLLPGDDAAITVSERGMSILINDALAPIGHPMHEFIADHGVEIREVTATDLRSNSEIILLGRWHDQGDEIESFEPYFTCKTCDEGRVTTTKYGYDFYGIGGDRFGLEFNAEIDGKYAYATLKAATAQHTDYSHLRPKLAEMLGLPTGVVWYPEAPSALPFLVVEHANETIELASA